jgi:hypothetical protein
MVCEHVRILCIDDVADSWLKGDPNEAFLGFSAAATLGRGIIKTFD